MRRRSRSRPARPYVCRFSSLSRVIRPSVWPLLQGVASAARTAAPSFSRPAAKVSTAGTAQARASLAVEAQAARELADAATVPTSLPVAIGEPGVGYPLPWSVHTWLSGHDATVEDPAASNGFAHDLAQLIAGMRADDTRGRRFDGVGRGGHLPDHDEWLETCFRRSENLLDVPALRRIWAGLRTLPEVDEDGMCHRDLTPPNVLVDDGRLVGVLDGGGYGPADPALDLVAAWHLLDETPRGILRRELGCGDVQWRRGMAWAFEQAMGLVWYYLDSNPTMSRWGMRSLDRIVHACAAPARTTGS